jgi:hypothetical protein
MADSSDTNVRVSTKLGQLHALGIVMARFLLAVLIGIGLTLAWQSYGEEAKQIVGPWARDMITNNVPFLARVLPSSTERPSHADDAPKKAQGDDAPKQNRSVPWRDVTDVEVPKPPATSSEPGKQLEALARDLASIRRSTELFAAKQQEMAETIAKLQAGIEQKLSTLQAQIEQKQASPTIPRAVAMPSETTAPPARRVTPSR